MAYKCREELVGKRFLSVSSGYGRLKLDKISEWGWRAGVIRAATHRDNAHQDLQVLVEYDDVEWHRREWISVYREGLFHLFMVEQGLHWAERSDPFCPSPLRSTVLWPALTFTSLVSTLDEPMQTKPVEFLLDKEVAFKDYKLLSPFQEWDSKLPGVKNYPELKTAVRKWIEQQDCQKIMMTTPSVLPGYRVEVYRSEGTTQWYTAVVYGYNEAFKGLTVTDDTVLENHNVDPAVVQMRLIGDGVVESIMRGENVGIRRSRSALLQQPNNHHQPGRYFRRRKLRGARKSVSPQSSGGLLQELSTEKDVTKAVRKRKGSENEKQRKGDVEQQEERKRSNGKSRHLEEADDNGKLRDAVVETEDEGEFSDSSVELVVVGASSVSDDEKVAVGEEGGVVESIVTEVGLKVPGATLDDEGPMSVRSPFSSSSRMELSDGGGVGAVSLSLRFPDDRSDSGVSSLRSGSSGDERSGSRSSALSSSDEPQPQSTTPSATATSAQGQLTAAAPTNSAAPTNAARRSPLFIPATHPYSTDRAPSEPVRVWRDPSLLLDSEPHVRHIHSVQHQSLLMSHPSVGASSTSAAPTPPSSAAATPQPPPTKQPTSASSAEHQHQQHQQQAAAAAAIARLYPPVPAPPLMAPHHLPPHHAPLPPGLYSHHSLPEMLWNKRYQLPPVGAAHLIAQQAAVAHPAAEEMLERERAFAQERIMRQSHEVREVEKQQQKERERIERERQEERVKLEKEREKQEKEREQERERQEKQKQMVNKHFEESLRRANMKKENSTWNHLVSLPPPQRTTNQEDERKRVEQELHQREHQQQQQQQRHASRNSDIRDNRNYYISGSQRPPSAPSKTDYPPPAHSSRVPPGKTPVEKISMSSNHLNMYGYPAYQPNTFYSHEPKSKSEPQHHKVPQSTSLIVTKSNSGDHLERDPHPSLLSEVKNSVIVKHEAKNPHHVEPRVSHSQSPKLRTTDMMSHFYSVGTQQKSGAYDYRSPSQSPHHLASPHHHLEQKVGPSHHRPSGQIPSPHHQRQSPHQSHPPSDRYRSNSESQAMIFQMNPKVSYPYNIASTTMAHYTVSQTTAAEKSKLKVSSPAPLHIYGKPTPGITSGIPVSRVVENPKPISVSPSPYQQVPQYHPPHPQPSQMGNCLPPPAHSSRTSIDRVTLYDRGYSAPGGLQVKHSMQLGTSPPTAASAPSPIQRPHPQYIPGQNLATAVQTQPLDLGTKYDSATSPKRKGTPVSSSVSPVCLEVKKRRVDQQQSPRSSPQALQQPIYTNPPQLSRVSEPSPLIPSAATTITTVVNSYRPPVTCESLADVSVTPVLLMTEPQRVPSADGSSQHSSGTPPLVAQQQRNLESPNTPIKLSASNPSNVDSEKSNSPGPMKSANYPVRHLKKAWLKRHTGEDTEDTTGVVGSGTCVTLPINISKDVTATTGTTTLHSIGSMAVNSISKSKHFAGKTSTTNGRKVSATALNGHPNDLIGKEDSSSSDQERGRKSPPKRKPPKVKRKKGGLAKKSIADEKRRKPGNQSAAASESGSDSEKESGSEKDSDSGGSTTASAKKNGNNATGLKDKEGPRKRGRRPKSSKNDKSEEPRTKKAKEESAAPQRDPFRKPPIGQLKKTGESFLQDGPCFEVAPKLGKCRECRWTPNQRTKNMPNIFCRFYAFRRLRYTKNGQLAIAGFSDPHKDAMEEDIKLWLPSTESPPTDLDLDSSRFLLRQVGDHFCDLLVQEKDACAEHISEEKTIAWKRVVQGVREMCDVCETTLFNFHWACRKCGFVVCLDCYKGRKNGTIKVWGEAGKDRDEFSWLLCTNRVAHEQEKLMLTQIIAGDSLAKLGRMVHEMRELWNIEQFCACALSKEKLCNGAKKEIAKNILMNGSKKEIKEEEDGEGKVMNGIGLDLLASVAQSGDVKKEESSSDDEEEGGHSTLRELLIRPSHKPNGSRATSPGPSANKQKKVSGARIDTLDEVISSVIEDSVPKNSDSSIEIKSELKHFIRRYNWQAKGRSPLPIRIMTLTESKMLYPDVPHSWLCDGKLLRLMDPNHTGNLKIFQDQWKRGQPVIVSDVTKHLDKDLWNPEAFARDFGDEKNDLVNCMTGNLVPNQPMRKFWEGFDHFSKRLKDDRGNPMLLKLKDWPPGEDFAEMLPGRFSDLMKVLPLPDYTRRTGRLNLASRLPDCFVRPDLGPKMYNAYGSALHPTKGTTNLHLDISDAVNVMVYVGIPKDGDSEEHIKEAYRAIDEAGCDILTRRRVRDKGELPGALWHIYNARDADKIRDLLNKVVVEKGGRLEPNHDPIHDQSCYLDGPLRERLYKEYGVEGYAIVQCLGDAVFIPAGAPHQVRNLHNCIKVAEDFVSPENVSHCFHLTQEFRDLSDTHTNHEDKLQIKNIIYHAVKDSLSCLSAIYEKSEKERGNEQQNSNSLLDSGKTETT